MRLLSDRDKYPLIPTSVYGNKLPKGYESVMESIPPQKVVDRLEQHIGKLRGRSFRQFEWQIKDLVYRKQENFAGFKHFSILNFKEI